MRGIMSARSKPLDIIEPFTDEQRTFVESFVMPEAKSGVKMIDADNVSELVDLLKNEAKVL
jgi:electron transfer flavoprotein beta subunit